jgi:hypothetical protein
MFKDPVYNMMVDEKTAKHCQELKERESICALEPARVSSMPAKRMTTTAIAATAVTQTDTATENLPSMVIF